MIDIHLFATTFALIFLAELPDKTAFATLLLATKNRPSAVFVGVAAAFLVQTVVAILFGSLIALLPAKPVHIFAALMFFVFAYLTWRRKDQDDDEEIKISKTFWQSAFTSFMVIFIAEWGDLTQLATAALVAQYQNAMTILLAATLSLWSVTAVAVIVGQKMKNYIKPSILNRVSAVAFVIVGAVMLYHTLTT